MVADLLGTPFDSTQHNAMQCNTLFSVFCQQDQLITQLYRDIDSRAIAVNMAQQEAREANAARVDLESKLTEKQRQVAELTRELQVRAVNSLLH